jgi:hypothetical protein
MLEIKLLISPFNFNLANRVPVGHHITINVPLILKVQEIIFFRGHNIYIMGHLEEFF